MRNCCLTVNNAVQGVQGVQGKKQHPLHALKATRGVGLRDAVQGVHPSLSRASARTRAHTHPRAHAHVYPLHTLHTLHRPRVARVARVQGIATRLHTLHNTNYLFKKMEKIVCGKENTAFFNAQLRERVPALHALAKELYQHGLIDGLAGATLESIDPISSNEESEPLCASSSRFCRECSHWHADTVGDGTGIGHCDIDAQPTRLKWPQQNACRHFDAIGD